VRSPTLETIPPLRFEIRHPGHRAEVSSESDFVVMGRDPSCDIVIRDSRCSRRHASIRVVPEGFHLLDMGSANGVYVLGQKVEDAIIREGDVFSMGDVFVRILPEDMPATLAMPTKQAAAPPAPLPVEARRPLRSVAPRAAPRSAAASPEAPLLTPRVLAVSSIAVGLALMTGAWYVRPQLDSLAFPPFVIGVFSTVAGLGLLARAHWARSLHYALFVVWIVGCLLAPLGVIGFAYQFRGEGRAETDSFFAVVVAIGGFLALVAVVAAAFLARLYVPIPLPT